ncbi:hypothetical protein [Hymenobacter elongatus]|uniref:Uncharacterized protein n=1 Tax=Hymenobacter elongatus TaxID=877208 RepID=A0A4Z0PNY0_9BACT|nr:hypothetical protein [Hymenobacter elongatus]TGE18026.1 hypothetical protein E5J99_05670 [Hymenobacter elongatus]
MQPEDIDKLFRNQLQHHAPTPPAYLWEQLEAEIQPARKRPAMWLYAAAAMVALLIVAGGAWLLHTPAFAPTTGTLATSSPLKPSRNQQPTAVGTPKNPAGTQATADNGFSSSPSVAQVASPKKAPSAMPAPAPAVAASKQEPLVAGIISPEPKPARTAHLNSHPTKATTPASVATLAMAAASSAATARPERPAAPAVAAVVPPLPSAAQAGAIEVEVHRGPEAAPAVAAVDAPQLYESHSHLKNLFHKAKSAVKEGRVGIPKVDLPETVTVQVNVFNHSATKVIQL